MIAAIANLLPVTALITYARKSTGGANPRVLTHGLDTFCMNTTLAGHNTTQSTAIVKIAAAQAAHFVWWRSYCEQRRNSV